IGDRCATALSQLWARIVPIGRLHHGRAPMARILVIEDDAALREIVSYVLADAGYEVVEAANGADGLKEYLAAPPLIVLTDMGLLEIWGLQLLQALRHVAPAAVIIAYSGSLDALAQARQLTAYTLAKPFSLEDLLALVQTLVAASVSRSTESPPGPRTHGCT